MEKIEKHKNRHIYKQSYSLPGYNQKIKRWKQIEYQKQKKTLGKHKKTHMNKDTNKQKQPIYKTHTYKNTKIYRET